MHRKIRSSSRSLYGTTPAVLSMISSSQYRCHSLSLATHHSYHVSKSDQSDHHQQSLFSSSLSSSSPLLQCGHIYRAQVLLHHHECPRWSYPTLNIQNQSSQTLMCWNSQFCGTYYEFWQVQILFAQTSLFSLTPVLLNTVRHWKWLFKKLCRH